MEIKKFLEHIEYGFRYVGYIIVFITFIFLCLDQFKEPNDSIAHDLPKSIPQVPKDPSIKNPNQPADDNGNSSSNLKPWNDMNSQLPTKNISLEAQKLETVSLGNHQISDLIEITTDKGFIVPLPESDNNGEVYVEVPNSTQRINLKFNDDSEINFNARNIQ